MVERFEQLVCHDPATLSVRRATETVHRLGELAFYMLVPQVLELAARHPDARVARLATVDPIPKHHRPGVCWGIFVNPHPNRWPLLRPAFLLPFQWRRTEPLSGRGKHSPRLPESVRGLADSIVTQLAEHGKTGEIGSIDHRWSLHWPDGVETLGGDMLANLPLKPGSAWAALAGGLIVAALGGKPDPKILATGAWSNQKDGVPAGIVDVDSLDQKIKLAAEMGASQLFVPASQYHVAQQYANRRVPKTNRHPLRIGTLDIGQATPRKALHALTSVLQVEPTENDSLETMAGYYLSARPRSRVSDFYRRRLAPRLAKTHRKLLRDRFPEVRPSHLVSVVSQSWELVELTVQLLTDAEGEECRGNSLTDCLLFYTGDRPDLKAVAHRYVEWLGTRRITCRPAEIRFGKAMDSDIRIHLDSFLATVPPERVVFDLTPGFRLVLISLLRSAPAGSLLLNWFNENVDGRGKPGTEYPQFWRVEEAMRLELLDAHGTADGVPQVSPSISGTR